MSCCSECGCTRRRRRRCASTCCRPRIRIPRALVAGVLLALVANNLRSLLNPVSNNNINIINVNSDNYDPDECENECENECRNKCYHSGNCNVSCRH